MLSAWLSRAAFFERLCKGNHAALNLERNLIRRNGGRPLRKYGTDGTLRGRPGEGRSVRKGDRYRLQQNTHRDMVRRRGTYLLVDRNGSARSMSARRVSRELGRGPWYSDRTYPHKFLRTKRAGGR